MPSDLQRVARGLVECLDEVPQVVAHLQRTAERCRENAALAMAASHGRATVAAQQLDAAARSCEQAAHYLSMAPPKARAWAERLVGASRSSDQPDARSADRNRATGRSGDIAERDVFGRVERLSLPFKPSEPAEGNEPPLIQVARKAFEKLRENPWNRGVYSANGAAKVLPSRLRPIHSPTLAPVPRPLAPERRPDRQPPPASDEL